MAVKDGKLKENSRKLFGRAYLCGMNLAFKRSGVIKFFNVRSTAFLRPGMSGYSAEEAL